jgi:branched-chain amino acid transport system substrate-binding protein
MYGRWDVQRTRWTFLLVLLAVSLMMVGLLAVGCGSGTTTTTAAAGGTATTAAAPASTDTTAAAAPGDTTATTAAAATGGQPEVIKVGLIAYKGWSLGLSMQKTLAVMAQMDKDAGGFDVGGKKYVIDFVSYDSNGDNATAITEMNRLIFQDKVKFVISDAMTTDPLVSIAEKNKVLLIGEGQATGLYDVNNKYSFGGDGSWFTPRIFMPWFAQAFPDVKTCGAFGSDDAVGHMIVDVNGVSFDAVGIKTTKSFAPASQTDLSSVGTKIAAMNPGCVYAGYATSTGQSSVVKAAWNAGYRGYFAEGNTVQIALLKDLVPAEALDHYYAEGEWTEFDPSLSAEGDAFKAAFAKMYGSWDPSTTVCPTGQYACLKAALQKAAQVDPTAAAAALAAGLDYSCPAGPLRMVPEKEGGTMAKASIAAWAMKKGGTDGKVQLAKQLTLDEAVALYYNVTKAMDAISATATTAAK